METALGPLQPPTACERRNLASPSLPEGSITGSILDELVLHKGLSTAVLHSLSTSWAVNASRAMGAPRALAFVERCLGFLLYLAFNRPGALTTNPTTDSLHAPSDGSDVGQVEFLDQFM